MLGLLEMDTATLAVNRKKRSIPLYVYVLECYLPPLSIARKILAGGMFSM